MISWVEYSFNPRAREGRDLPPRGGYLDGMVSIRAPARGATPSFSLVSAGGWFQSARPRGARRMPTHSSHHCGVFQSARPRGARRLNLTPPETKKMFQSARPRGARRGTRSGRCRAGRFNPRAREGRDVHKSAKSHNKTSFNPRAREGRDNSGGGDRQQQRVSIRAPATGAT